MDEKHELNPILKLLKDNNQYHHRNGKRISVYLKERYDFYIKSLEQSIKEDNFIDSSFIDELRKRLPSIKATTDNILKSYELYEENKLLEAECISKKVLFDNSNNMIIRSLGRKEERSMYRIRPNDNYPIKRRELFHVPMSTREICKDGRFSKKGVPCLYLATQLPLSWLEMDKPEICMAAKFALNDNYYNKIKVVDISGKQISDAYQLFADISNNRNKGKNLSASYEYLIKVICMIPIRLATTIPSEENENKQEYYFSQVFLEWAKDNKIADGIIYESCKSEEAWAYFGCNLAFFVNEVDEEGYDIKLRSIFNMSKPHVLKDIKRPEDLFWEEFSEIKSLSESLE
ncbi:MAG: RES domain-containing protein [Pseudobutyrivibrio sp.]|uniref:RES domain-containing protein n=1 Tax=Pseudobutyrivibrio sp. TaxID=2014367 RepID=UPI0025D08C98|nr:RES domain-containing protein [Pseudobutyrivibrio sp.]MBQ8490568.1 RES domain-containing protein [Pseudobutyrivibrio sp.]